MPDEVSVLEVGLYGDDSSLERALTRALTLLDRFTSGTATYAREIKTSLDSAFAGTDRLTSKLERTVGAVNTGLERTASVAAAVVAPLESATNAITGLAEAEQAAGRVASTAGRALETMGERTAAAMSAVGGAVERGEASLNNLTAVIERTRAEASRPIRVAVETPPTPGGGAGGGGGGGRGRGGGAGIERMGGLFALGMVGAQLSSAGERIKDWLTEAVKGGADLDDQIQNLYAHAGETAPLETFRRGLLGISNQFDQLPAKLAAAAYPIESVGFHGAAGLTVLANAAKLTKGSGAELMDSGNLMAKTLTVYGLAAQDSGHLTDLFVKGIREAVSTGKEYVPAFSNMMGVGHSLNLTLEEQAAALAVVSQQTKSTATASTYLKNFFNGLITPTAQMRKAAHAAGLEWLAMGEGAAHVRAVGFPQTLAEIERATNGNATAFGKLFPDLRKNQAVLALLNDGGAKFNRIFGELSNVTGEGDRAVKEMDKSLGQMGRSLQSKLATAAANITVALEPALVALGHAISGVLNWFNQLPEGAQRAFALFAAGASILLLLAGNALQLATNLGMLVVAWPELVEIAGPVVAALGPVGLALLGVAAAVALLVTAWQRDWGHIREVTASILAWARPYIAEFTGWLTGEWNALTANLVTFWKQIQPEIQAVLSFLARLIRGFLDNVVSNFQVWGPAIWGVLTAVWGFIKLIFQGAFDAISGALRIFLDLITGHWGKAWQDLVGTAVKLADDVEDAVYGMLNNLADGFSNTLKSIGAYWREFWLELGRSGDINAAMEQASKSASVAHGGQTLSGASAAAAGGRTVDTGAGLRATMTADAARRAAEHPAAKPPLPAEPDWVKNFGKKTGRGGGAHTTSPSLPPLMTDLAPMEALTSSGSDLSGAVTNAANFGAKKDALDAAYAEKQLRLREAGQAVDTFAQTTEHLTQRMRLEEEAIRSTAVALSLATGFVRDDEAAVRKAFAARDAFKRAIDDKRNAGGKVTVAEANELARLDTAAKAAQRRYQEDNRLLAENVRVHRQAVEEKTRDMEAYARAQDEEDKKLDAAVKKQEEAAKRRADAEKAMRHETLTMDKRDRAAALEDLSDRVRDAQEKGVSPETIAAFTTARTAQIEKQSFDAQFREADDAMKASLADGTATLAQYRLFLTDTLAAATASFGAQSEEASRLAREIAHVDWQAADVQATRLKEALDGGTITLTRYIADMKALRASVAATSPEYRKLTGEVDAAQKKLREDTKRRADQIAGDYASAFMRILHGTATVGQVVRETIHKAIDSAIEGAVKRWVSGIVFKFLNQGNQSREEAEKRRLADQAQQAANTHRLAAETFTQGVTDFGTWITQFADTVGAMLSSGSSGGGVAGTGTSGGFGAAQTALGGGAVAGGPSAAAIGAAQTAVGITADVLAGRSTGGGLAAGVESASAAAVAAGASGLAGEVSRAMKGGASKSAAEAAAGLDVAGKAASGNVLGAATSAAGAGWLGKAASQVVPWLGIGLTAASLLGGLFGGHNKPDYQLRTGEGRYSQIGSGDHTGLIDSGYAGVDALRRLQTQAGARADAAAGQRTPTQQHQVNNHFAQGAIVVVAQPHHDVTQIAKEVVRQIQTTTAIDNAFTGRS